jgi:hypothetical protein
MSVTVPAPSRQKGPNAITPPELSPIAPPVTPTPSSIKDSVELLLEGMAGPRPERRKTTPQSDGEASASYHAEHGVRRARTSEPAGPKVLVERPVLGSLLPAQAAAPPPPRAPAGSRESVSTFVPARVLRRRAAMAVVAGLLFVLVSFVAMRLTGRHVSAAATAPVEMTIAPAQAPAPPVETPAAMPIVSTLTIPSSRATAAPSASTTAEPPRGADSHPEAPPATTRPHRGEAEPARTHEAPASSGDLGEFKSKF